MKKYFIIECSDGRKWNVKNKTKWLITNNLFHLDRSLRNEGWQKDSSSGLEYKCDKEYVESLDEIELGLGEIKSANKEIEVLSEVDEDFVNVGKVKDYGDYYNIETGSDVFRITKDEVRRLKKLYCLDNLNINQVCLEMDILRKEFFIIKTAFSIVKTDPPFIDEDFDEKTPEELAEKVRIEKKRAFFRHLDRKKFEDIENELKKLHQKDYYYNMAIENFKEIEITPPILKLENIERSKIAILGVADLHIGAEYESVLNVFNKDIAEQRFRELTEKTIKYCKKENIKTLKVLSIGDLVEGIINVSGRIRSDLDVIQATQHATKLILEMLYSFCEHIENVEYYQVNGNHSRVMASKKDSLASENFCNFIVWYLKSATNTWNNLTIFDNRLDDIAEIEVFDKKIVCVHGNEGNAKHLKNIDNILGYLVEEILVGHWHSHKIQDINSTKVITSPSFIGINEYAESKLLFSKPCQLLHIYDESGDKNTYEIYFGV